MANAKTEEGSGAVRATPAPALEATVPTNPSRLSGDETVPASRTSGSVDADVEALWDAGYDPLVNRVVGGGRYRLIKRLGTGGMGAVYLAETDDKSQVAIKVIRPGMVDIDAMRRIVREARAATAVQSDHVIHVEGVVMDPELQTPIIVMDYLQGKDLGEHLAELGPMKPEIAARIFVQAARGLAAAHEQGIIHRDIKPANIFLHREENGRIVVKVCDFGVAKLGDALRGASSDITDTGGVVGSPAYMSPEQMQDSKRATVLSDIWSLSVALWQTLAGRLPWSSAGGFSELMLAIFTRDVLDLSGEAPWLSSDVVKAVHLGLRRAPEARYQSMKAMATALEAFTGGTLELTVADVEAAGVPFKRRASSYPPETASEASRARSLVRSVDATTAPRRPETKRNYGWAAAISAGVIALVGAVLLQPKLRANDPVSAAASINTVTTIASTMPSASPTEVASVATPASANVPSASSSAASPNAPVRPTKDPRKPEPGDTAKSKPGPAPTSTAAAPNPALTLQKDW